MRKFVFLAGVMACALALAKPAAAEAVNFDPDGAGPMGAVGGTIFDWAPGNSILQENATATAGTILFQANLGSVLDENLIPVFGNGTGGNFFSIVAVIDVTLQGGGNFTTVGGTFKIYHDTDPGSNLTGLGFAADAGSTEVVSGSLVSGSGGLALNPNVTAQLDQFPTAADNNYPGNITWVSTSGSSNSTGIVNTFNSAYLQNLIAGVSMTITSTKILLPYTQVQPSARFSSNAIADGDALGVSGTNLCGPGQAGTVLNPCINGSGSNIIAETDSSTSFQGLAAVPEPATMTLLGLGLLGSAAARRRQMKAKKVA